MSELELHGYVENDGEFFNLYKRLYQNTKTNKYFLKIKNEDKDFYYKKLDENKYRYLYHGDSIEYNNKTYTVNVYNNTYYHGGSWINKWSVPKYYLNPHNDTPTYTINDYVIRRQPIINDDLYLNNGLDKIGIMEDSEGDFKVVYSKPISRNQWQYYTKMGDIFIKLDISNNEIGGGEVIPFSGTNYIFNSDV